MKYRLRRGLEEVSEDTVPACYRLVKVLGTTNETNTERIHNVLISLEEQVEPAEAFRQWSVRFDDRTGARKEETRDR
jgi:hypothetical protein